MFALVAVPLLMTPVQSSQRGDEDFNPACTLRSRRLRSQSRRRAPPAVPEKRANRVPPLELPRLLPLSPHVIPDLAARGRIMWISLRRGGRGQPWDFGCEPSLSPERPAPSWTCLRPFVVGRWRRYEGITDRLF
ncbi:hypothetical protein EYF80_005028 [Liparis tanakae]|uniref:Secreted protein n=1 Tax=Liparis tanakae TaxID=230148 RepID=A0A4Z2J532_9TELE|nr:hypothetical protein EYF80_005028 [Liparis tanakae]